MSAMVVSTGAAIIGAATRIFAAQTSWPDPATGLASRIFARAGMAPISPINQPLRVTTAALLRRTPEIAAFGYALALAGADTLRLWLDAIEHLRGRDIFPADRQSFIFNPIEVLGIAAGLALDVTPVEHRRWLAETITHGMSQGQFRTPLSQLAASSSLMVLDENLARSWPHTQLDVDNLATNDLTLAAAIYLGFIGTTAESYFRIETALMRRVLSDEVAVGDAAEAAALLVLTQRVVDRITLSSAEISAEERIIALCRRFPLFVDRLKHRQRARAPFSIVDEYDVQDLLHAILKLHFDDVRDEEVTPSHAGNASRVDFFLPAERIVVEAKMTRQNLGQKEVANELAIDAARYSQMGTVDTLICLIYDPDRRCSNPTSLEADVEANAGRLRVRAVVCPHGL